MPGNSRLAGMQCAAQQKVRKLTWDFYADLKLYQANPGKRHRPALRARFDRIVRRHTGFVTPDRLLARLYGDKAALLMVLDRPETPLNTNGSGHVLIPPLPEPRPLPRSVGLK